MAKKIELLNDQQEVVHPLTSADCVIMENGETLDKVMGDGIATPTLTHEGTSFKVGVGDSNIEVVDGDVAGMTLKGQSYQNILPKPTTLIMETDEKDFKINDKIDSNIIIDDNIAEIATVKGKTIVNAVQEESASEYTVLGEDLSGQSIITTNKPEGSIKGVTLQGQTLVNTIQESSDYESVVIGEDLSGQSITIEQDVKGLEGMTLTNYQPSATFNINSDSPYIAYYTIPPLYKNMKPNTRYMIKFLNKPSKINRVYIENVIEKDNIQYFYDKNYVFFTTKDVIDENTGYQYIHCYTANTDPLTESDLNNVKILLLEYQEGLENLDIPYFEGTKYFDYSTPRYINGAILKGQTLVNLSKVSSHDFAQGRTPIYDLAQPMKANTTYTIFINVTLTGGLGIFVRFGKNVEGGYTQYRYLPNVGLYKFTVTPDMEYTQFAPYIQLSDYNAGIYGKYDNLVIIEGDYTNQDIPYFEGMQSVKMPVLSTTGKNLFDVSKSIYHANGNIVGETVTNQHYFHSILTEQNGGLFNRKDITKLIKLDKGHYFFSGNIIKGNLMLYAYDLNGQYISQSIYLNKGITFTQDVYIDILVPNPMEFDISNIQLEKRTEPSPFEPYKSNILMVNEEVELRGVGDVQDELNLLTGELTQRFEQFELNSAKYFANNTYTDLGNTIRWQTTGDFKTMINLKTQGQVMSNTFVSDSSHNDYEHIRLDGSSPNAHLILYLNKTKATTYKELNTYLQNNPLIIIGEKANESIKKVDLIVLDQDGNELPHPQLQTPINHITTSSDALTPVVNISSTVNYDAIIKPSTQYTLRFNQDEVNTDNPLTVNLGGTEQVVTSNHFTMTTPSTLTHNQLQFSGKGNVVSKVQVIEGDVTGIEYPYFEGMNSVGQTVLKNCLPSLLNFYKDDHTQKVNAWFGAGSGDFNFSVDDNGLLSMTMISTGSRVLRCDDLTKVKPNTKYLVKIKYTTSSNTINFGYLDTDVVYHHLATEILSDTWFVVTTPSSDKMIGMWFGALSNIQSGVKLTFKDIQMIEYQDDMENWYIPYFEDEQKISDVKMKVTGKNLCCSLPYKNYCGLEFKESNNSETTVNGTLTVTYWDYYIIDSGVGDVVYEYYQSLFDNMEVGQTLHLHSNLTNQAHYISIKSPTSNSTIYSRNSYTKRTNDDKLCGGFIRFNEGDTFTNQILQVQVEIGAEPTPYEPRHEVIVQQDIDSIPLTSDMFEQGNIASGKIVGMSYQQLNHNTETVRVKSKTLIPIKPNGKYIIQNLNKTNNRLWGWQYDKNGGYLSFIGNTDAQDVFQFDSKAHYITFVLCNQNDSVISPSDLDSMNLILQEVPQEIVLRGIGDVKDELDLTRGEYIQRIGVINNISQIIGSYFDSSYMVGDKCALLYNLKDDMPKLKRNVSTTNLVPIYASNFADVSTMQLGSDNGAWTHKNQQETQNICTISTVNANYDICITIPNSLTGVTSVDNTGTAITEKFNNYIKSLDNFEIHYILDTPIVHEVNLTNMNKIPSYSSKTTYTTQQPQDSLIPNITIPSTLNYNVAIKPSTEYTIRANTSDNLTVDLGGTIGTLSNGKVTLTTPATLTHNEVKFSGTGKVKELMVVEGNEIKDNVPFFNGMKDVQMGGIKLVNIARGATCNSLVTTNTNKTQFTYTGNGNNWGDIFFDKSLLKPNTLYTIYFNIVSNNSNATEPIKISLGDDLNTWVNATGTGLVKKTFSSNNNLSNNFGIMFRPCSSGQKVVIQNPMVIEGDWTHLDEIPYIESEMIIDQPIIRSQGKNLFDINKVAEHSSIVKDGNTLIMTRENPNDRDWVKVDISLPKGTYTFSCSGVDGTIFRFSAFTYDNVEIYSWQKFNQTYTFNTDIAYLKISTETIGVTYNVTNIQIEEGSTATPYEPYKHQTLYSNRVIGYEENCYYDSSDGIKHTHNYVNSVIADVEGLSIAYITNVSTNITFWDKDNIFISGKPHIDTGLSNPDVNGFVIVPSNAKYVKFASGNVSEEYATYYTKAAVTGDLPLRSLPNGVCDTLNLVTGEYVQRVGEVVLDGSQKEEDWLYTPTNQTLRIQVVDVVSIQNTSTDPLRNKILVSSDKLTSRAYVEDWNSGTFISLALDKRIVLRIEGITNRSELIKYLKQNPITVQYQLATPIVRKLGFTTKGNYREQVLDGSETWAMDAIDNTTTVRMTKKTTSPLQNPLYDTVLFTDDYHVRARDESHSTYEYITCIGNGIYINIYQSKVNELSVEGCTQWLSQNPIKVGYITSGQSSESYSNIHKPIFFNDVNVKFLNNNIDIQPELTYQVRTRNSYVMDMMKPNTTYTSKFLLSNNGSTTVDGTTINTKINSTFTSPSTLTNKLMITPINRHEFMIIEGDVTGKNLPYFKGILSSYHDVDEIEVYSATKNLFNIHDVQIESNKWETIIDTEKCKITSKRVIEDNTGAFATRIVINNIKPSTRYCLRWVSDNGGMIYVYTTELWDSANQLTATHGSDGKAIFYTPANTDKIVIGLNYGDTNGLSGKDYRTLSDIALYEIGVNEEITEKPAYIPHAHNTTRIEMPTRLETVKVVRPVIESGSIHTETGESFDRDDAPVRNVRTSYIPVEPNEMIKFYNGNSGRAVNVFYYDIDKQFIGFEYYDGTSASPTVPKNCYFVRMYCGKATCDDITFVRSAYKPIQLNSLPNGTSDEIIIKPNSNKAQLVQRVGKVVLDGCDYTFGAYAGEVKGNDVMCKYISYTDGKNGGLCISDRFLTPTYSNQYTNIETIMFGTNTIIMSILRARTNSTSIEEYLKDNPITVYYELKTPIIHEIQLKGYPHVYEDGTVTFNTDTPHQTVVSYNVDQEQLITNQNETIIRHDKQIDDLYYYIELYLEEIYQMELFRMQVELSL